MSHEEILKKHKIGTDLVDGVAFVPSVVNRLVISFTGMNPGKFERWSWFHEWYQSDCSTLYIVLRDEEHLFYLNRKSRLVQRDTLTFLIGIMSKYNIDPSSVVTVGSSMGGYAAIHYGCTLNVGLSISSVPLVDTESASLNKYSLWTRKMNELESNWVDLHEFVQSHSSCPTIHLIHGKYEADLMAATKLKKSLLSRNAQVYCTSTDNDCHGDYLTKEMLRDLLTQDDI
jgi:predicted esterase